MIARGWRYKKALACILSMALLFTTVFCGAGSYYAYGAAESAMGGTQQSNNQDVVVTSEGNDGADETGEEQPQTTASETAPAQNNGSELEDEGAENDEDNVNEEENAQTTASETAPTQNNGSESEDEGAENDGDDVNEEEQPQTTASETAPTPAQNTGSELENEGAENDGDDVNEEKKTQTTASETAPSQNKSDELDSALPVEEDDEEKPDVEYCPLCQVHNMETVHSPEECPYDEFNIGAMNSVIADNQILNEDMAAAQEDESMAQEKKGILFFEKIINRIWDAYQSLKAVVENIFEANNKIDEEKSIVDNHDALETAKEAEDILIEESAETTEGAIEQTTEGAIEQTTEGAIEQTTGEAVQLPTDPVGLIQREVSTFEATDEFVAENMGYIPQVWTYLTKMYNCELYDEETISDYIRFTFSNWETASASEPPAISEEWQLLVDTYRLWLIADGQYCHECYELFGTKTVHLNEIGLYENCPVEPEPVDTVDIDEADKKDSSTETTIESKSYLSSNSVYDTCYVSAVRYLSTLDVDDDALDLDMGLDLDREVGSDIVVEEGQELPRLFAMALMSVSPSPVQPDSSSSSSYTIGGRAGADPYKVTVDKYGRITIYRDTTGYGNYSEKQYYGPNANGSSLTFDAGGSGQSTFTTHYLGGSMTGSYNGGTVYVASNTLLSDGRTIKTVFPAKNDVQLTQYVQLPQGANYLNKWWEIKNYGSNIETKTSFIHGGDTYFAGSDYGYCYFNRGIKSVYVKKDSTTGMMSFIWDSGTPADNYFVGHYGTGASQAKAGLLQNYAESSKVDASYYLQWYKPTLAAGETWTIKTTEGFTQKGNIQVMAPSEKTVAPGSLVSYRFTLMNLGNTDTEVKLNAFSANGYVANIRTTDYITASGDGYVVTVPKASDVNLGTRTVIVDCEIPSDALGLASNLEDSVTLVSTFSDEGNVTRSNSVNTLIKANMPNIDRVVVVEKTDTDITAKVVVSGLTTGQRVTLSAILTDEDGNSVGEKIVKGGITVNNDDVNGLIEQLILPIIDIADSEKTYYINVDVQVSNGDGSTVDVDNPNPNDTTTIVPNSPNFSATAGIEITGSGIMYNGESQTLNVIVRPSNASSRLSWASSSPELLSVDGSGTVTANGNAGTAVITANATDGSGVSGSVEITVKPVPSRIDMMETELTVVSGGAATLTAVVYPEAYVLEANQIQWSMSSGADSFIAEGEPTVNGNKAYFPITAQSAMDAGSHATISATITAGGRNFTAQCDVRIVSALPISLDITTAVGVALDTLKMSPGEAISLSALVAPNEAMASLANSDVVWTTNRNDLISFGEPDAGDIGTKITAASGKMGEATVTATYNNGGTVLSKAVTVTVGTAVSGMTITSNSALMGKGESQNLYILYEPSYADNKGVRWTVTGPATITDDGLLTINNDAEAGSRIEIGAVLIADETITATGTIKVESKLEELAISGPATMFVGDTASFAVKMTPSGLSNEQKAMKWSYTGNPVSLSSMTGESITVTVPSTAAVGMTTLKVDSQANSNISATLQINIVKQALNCTIASVGDEVLAEPVNGYYKQVVKLNSEDGTILYGRIAEQRASCNDTWTSYTAEQHPFEVLAAENNNFTAGEYIVEVYGINGNIVSETNRMTICVDSAAPSIEAVGLTGGVDSGGKYVSKDKITVTTSVSDTVTTSGIASVQYRLLNSAEVQLADWQNILQSGTQYKVDITEAMNGYVELRAIDRAGTISQISRKAIAIVNSVSAPAIKIGTTDSAIWDDSQWQVADTNVSIYGVTDAAVTYTSTGSVWQEVSDSPTSVNLTQDGVHNVTAQAVDIVGNIATSSAVVKIDKTKPTVSAVYLSSDNMISDDGTFVASGALTITASALDETSSVEKMQYQVISGGATQLGWTDMNSQGGIFTASYSTAFDGKINVQAVDNAGNISEITSKAAAIVTVPAAPSDSVVKINYLREVITYDDSIYEVSTTEASDDIASETRIASGGGITPGAAVYVRVMVQGNTPASDFTSVNIPTRPEAPSVGSKNETIEGMNDGIITSVDDAMEWKSSDAAISAYVSISATEQLTGVTPGAYNIRKKAVASGESVAGAFAGYDAFVTIELGAARNYSITAAAISFDDIAYGDNMTSSVTPESICISAIGNMATTVTAVTLTTGTSFTVTSAGGVDNVALSGENTTWSIAPIGELATTYTDNVQIEYISDAEDNTETILLPVSFTIKPKHVGITWSELIFTADGNSHSITAAAAENDLLDADRGNVTVTLEGTASESAPGTYTVTASGLGGSAAENYSMTPETVQWTISNLGSSENPYQVNTIDGLNAAIASGGSILVTENMTMEAITITSRVAISVQDGNTLGIEKITVRNGAEFTFDGGTVEGTQDEVINVENGGVFILTGSSILNGNIVNDGGTVEISGNSTVNGTQDEVINVENGGVFILTGSSILNGNIVNDGGTVEISGNGTVNGMTGSSIYTTGAGIIKLSGNPTIGTIGGNGIYLGEGSYINVEGPMTNTSPIGITVENPSGNPMVVTSSAVALADIAGKFAAEAEGQTITQKADGLHIEIRSSGSRPSGKSNKPEFKNDVIESTSISGAGSTGSGEGGSTEAAKESHGTVKVNGSGTPGNTVVVTVTPETSFEIGSVAVTDANGNELTVIDNGDGTYSYVMPSDDTKIDVTYEPIFGEEKETPNFENAEESRQVLTVDGSSVNASVYNVDGYNYVKLRDMAMLMNGTKSQFAVTFGGKTVRIETGKAYEPIGGELEPGTDISGSCVVSRWTINVNGVDRYLNVYNIGGNNHFRLADLGQLLGFDVSYDEAADAARVTTK